MRLTKFFCLCLLIFPSSSISLAHQGFGKKDLNEAKKLFTGTLYLRIDLPCRYGRHAFGSYVDPMVQVGPVKSNVEGSLETQSGYWSAEGVFWGFGPNDPMKFTGIGIDKGKIWVSLDGMGPKGTMKNEEAILNFVDINSMDDFKTAFNRVFSRVPLQDEHPDWSAEVKKAIVDKKVIKGMTTAQAFCVVGTPMGVTGSEEGGKKVETWVPRQSNGTHVRWAAWSFSGGTQTSSMTGFPVTLKFVDGVLTEIGPIPNVGKIE